MEGSKSKLLTKVHSAKSKQQILSLKPSNIQSVTAWTNWVKTKTSTASKVVYVHFSFIFRI